MENTTIRVKKVIKISRKKLIILIIVLVVGFILLNKNNNQYQYGIIPTSNMGSMESVNGVSAPSSTSMPYYKGGYQEDSSVKDTREFMKVAYGAEIKTRDVKDAIRDVKNAIRDAEGRIDNLNETKKYAYVNFVIPKSNLSNFKDEIESITHEKLYTENSSSQNLLGQKQSIEQQKETVTISLAERKNSQKNLTAQHTTTVNNLQKQLTDIQNQLVVVRASISNTSDSNQLAILRNQEYNLSQQELSLKQSISSENTNYTISNQNIKNQISDLNLQLTNIGKQDVAFTDNIETVNGYISVNWISFWDMAKVFSPIHPGFVITILALLTWYYLSRKNYIPGIEFV